jgi:hypothetical protein
MHLSCPLISCNLFFSAGESWFFSEKTSKISNSSKRSFLIFLLLASTLMLQPFILFLRRLKLYQ